ncbi:MAG: hypothetical protein AAB116_13340, partial [Candidatus Poribacteria bacterium]
TAQYLDVDKKNSRVTFMDYWDIVPQSKKELNIQLTQKVSMKRLNDARNNFKHQGMIFSKLDIESYRASAANFFAENTPLIFGIEFSDLSLIDLIQFDNAKNALKEAQEQLNKNMIEKALENISIAFDQLISDYENTKRGVFGSTPFDFGNSFASIRASDIFAGKNPKSVAELSFNQRKFEDFINSVNASMKSIQLALKLISLGIDYRKYSKFHLYMPITNRTQNGGYFFDFMGKLPTTQDAQFCIDFIIESAIILQEFDYVIEH